MRGIGKQCRTLQRGNESRHGRKSALVPAVPKQIMPRAYASPHPPNGQFVFADCLYLGTLSRPEITVSSFHLGMKRNDFVVEGADVGQISASLFFVARLSNSGLTLNIRQKLAAAEMMESITTPGAIHNTANHHYAQKLRAGLLRNRDSPPWQARVG